MLNFSAQNKLHNMKKFIPTRLAEIIFALIIGYFGAFHMKYGATIKGVPEYFPGNGTIWVYIVGIGFGLAAIAILINKFKTLACYLLAAMFLVFILTLHVPQVMRDGNLYQLLKDAGLAMAAIIIGNNTKK